MILVKNKRTYMGDGIYCGRPSALGNPFIIGRDGNRDDVIRKYERYFDQAWNDCTQVYVAFEELVRRAATGEIIHLICWCDPEPCHCHVLKRKIEERLRRLPDTH